MVHHISKGLFAKVPFANHIMSVFQQKNYQYTEGKKYNLKKMNKHQYIAEMLELLDQEFF
jgi:hypothetical protein